MEAFLVSIAVVAVAEIGDKTQLLALLLACRFRRPLPIALGVLVATLANHAAAAFAGNWLLQVVDPAILRWGLGASFFAVAIWALIPDKLEDEPRLWDKAGPFLATLTAFFLVEIGDKTQIATVGLAIRFDSLLAVVFGTALGMVLANGPVIVFGDALAKKLPLRFVRLCAAIVFAVLGLAVLADWQ
ncbi:MAG TPA: TMEM165/GDT1 family protein [Alphaproteobacteria bacterium]|nr:TMEM165/GDT1 family protein [Alphaproteobacteria bacterium]